MSRFDDERYVRDYNRAEIYPRIHFDMHAMINTVVGECKTFADLGACTGLLSAYVANKKRRVFAIEANPRLINRAVKHDNITWMRMRLTEANFFRIPAGVDCVLARRVLPEISDGNPQTINALAMTLHLLNVRYVILEGRVYSKRSTHTLSSADREAECFKKYYSVADHKNSVIKLVANASV